MEPFSIDESWLDVTGSRELFGGEMEMAEASHNLFAERTNGRLYKRLVEPYIMGERRL